MRADALEAAANTVLGLLMGWALLTAYGLPPGHSAALQGAFVALSWVRVFFLRRVFRRIAMNAEIR